MPDPSAATAHRLRTFSSWQRLDTDVARGCAYFHGRQGSRGKLGGLGGVTGSKAAAAGSRVVM
jgi:hypothetical protein